MTEGDRRPVLDGWCDRCLLRWLAGERQPPTRALLIRELFTRGVIGRL